MTPDRVTRRRAGQPARKFQASRGGAHGSQPPVITSRSAAPDEDSGVAVEVWDHEEAIRVRGERSLPVGVEAAVACLRGGRRVTARGGEPPSACPAVRQGLLRAALGPVRTGGGAR